MADELPEIKNCQCGSRAFLNEEAVRVVPKTEDKPYTELVYGFSVQCYRLGCGVISEVKNTALEAITQWNCTK